MELTRIHITALVCSAFAFAQNDTYNPSYNKNEPNDTYNQPGQSEQPSQYDRDRFGQSTYDRDIDRYDTDWYGNRSRQQSQYDNYNQTNFTQQCGFRQPDDYVQPSDHAGESISNYSCCDDYCYVKDLDPYMKYDSNTTLVTGTPTNEHVILGCTPVQFWSLNTQGTSLPDEISVKRLQGLKQLRDDIIRNYENERYSRGSLCHDDLDQIKSYINRLSPWCAAFTKKHSQLLVYCSDLIDYYINEYENEINNLCNGSRWFKNMIDRFQRIVNGITNDEKVVVIFTHTAAFQQFLVSIGLGRRYELLPHAFRPRRPRQWQTSRMTPFGANLVAVLYECNSSSHDKYKVLFFLNEELVYPPKCAAGSCSWDQIRNKYIDAINACNTYHCGCASTNVASLMVCLLSGFVFLFLHFQF